MALEDEMLLTPSSSLNESRPFGANGYPRQVSWPSGWDDEAVSNAHPEVTYRAQAPVDNDLLPKPGGLGYKFVKRTFDMVFSLFATALALIPAAAACALVSIESPGSPIFAQERVGKNGRRIHILKIRSMYPDAHEHPERYLSEDQMDQWLMEQKVDNDPRITHIGKILRKTSLDELPQFLNVLAGQLSVIGPRPVTEAETWQFANARDEFLSCKPGITGWWQATERNAATWESGDRQRLELFYVRHACLGLDLRIFARTFKAILGGTGM